MPGHDIIVIGASAGGVEALMRLVAGLPRDLPAALFVVVHIPPQGPSMLPSILTRTGPLPASSPKDSEKIKKGHIYVAGPDCHLIIEDGDVRSAGGPRENRYRPAVDPLFRTAARHYGTRVVGVILTGSLDDGTSGLKAVKSRGGIAVVQDPQDALYASMPRSALENVEVDYTVPLAEMPDLLVRLAHQDVNEPDAYPVPLQLEIESKIAQTERAEMEEVERLGKPSGLTCPECHGALFEIRDGKLVRFRCQVGHAYSPESLLADQSDSVERALWAGLRALEEKAEIVRRLAGRSTMHNRIHSARAFEKRAAEMDEQADVIRQIIESNKGTTEDLTGT